jgi:hypothetical protein
MSTLLPRKLLGVTALQGLATCLLQRLASRDLSLAEEGLRGIFRIEAAQGMERNLQYHQREVETEGNGRFW